MLANTVTTMLASRVKAKRLCAQSSRAVGAVKWQAFAALRSQLCVCQQQAVELAIVGAPSPKKHGRATQRDSSSHGHCDFEIRAGFPVVTAIDTPGRPATEHAHHARPAFMLQPCGEATRSLVSLGAGEYGRNADALALLREQQRYTDEAVHAIDGGAWLERREAGRSQSCDIACLQNAAHQAFWRGLDARIFQIDVEAKPVQVKSPQVISVDKMSVSSRDLLLPRAAKVLPSMRVPIIPNLKLSAQGGLLASKANRASERRVLQTPGSTHEEISQPDQRAPDFENGLQGTTYPWLSQQQLPNEQCTLSLGASLPTWNDNFSPLGLDDVGTLWQENTVFTTTDASAGTSATYSDVNLAFVEYCGTTYVPEQTTMDRLPDQEGEIPDFRQCLVSGVDDVSRTKSNAEKSLVLNEPSVPTQKQQPTRRDSGHRGRSIGSRRHVTPNMRACFRCAQHKKKCNEGSKPSHSKTNACSNLEDRERKELGGPNHHVLCFYPRMCENVSEKCGRCGKCCEQWLSPSISNEWEKMKREWKKDYPRWTEEWNGTDRKK
ncbi:hypothetical protein Q7P37_009756 [Cladosporium fusiforme]